MSQIKKRSVLIKFSMIFLTCCFILVGVYLYLPPIPTDEVPEFQGLCRSSYEFGNYQSDENVNDLYVGDVWEKHIDISQISDMMNNETNLFNYDSFKPVAKITNPKGTEISQLGFFDGEKTFKFRAWLDIPGNWKYSIHLNEREISSNSLLVSPSSSDSKNVPPILIDERSSSHLIAGSTPFYWIGGKWIATQNTAPCSIRQHKHLRESHQWVHDNILLGYLDKLKEYKHNGTLVKIAQFPLLSDGISWDLEWIQRIEWVVREALKRQIYVQINIFDTWSRDRHFKVLNNTSADKHVFNTWEPTQTDLLKIKNYIYTIVARFSSYPNIMWELGNEMEHSPNCGDCFVRQANMYYLPWIRKMDNYNRLIGLSEGIWRDTDVDLGFFHQTRASDFEKLEFDPRPLVMNELVFADHVPPLWQDSTIRDPESRLAYRRTFWRSFMHGFSGSYEATWLNINNEFNQAVENVMNDHKIFAQFIANLNTDINRRKSLGKIQTNNEKINTYGVQLDSSRYLFYLLEENHLQDISDWNIRLDLPPGVYQYQWFNPSSGEYSDKIKKQVSDQLEVSNQANARDWVLIVTKANIRNNTSL